MKLAISTVTLAATLLSFFAADVSEEEIHQRVVLNMFSTRRSRHLFGRDLASDECSAKQEEVDNTGIIDMHEESIGDLNYCSIDGGNTPSDPTTEIECNYSALKVNSDPCISACGRVGRLSYDMFCYGMYRYMDQIPYGLH